MKFLLKDNKDKERYQAVLGLIKIGLPKNHVRNCIHYLSKETIRSPSKIVESLVSAEIKAENIRTALKHLNLKFGEEKELGIDNKKFPMAVTWLDKGIRKDKITLAF